MAGARVTHGDDLGSLTLSVNRVLGGEYPAQFAASMLEQADRTVAAHKRLIATYQGPMPGFLTDELIDGLSCTAMMFLLIAETATALMPAKSATTEEIRAVLIALEPRAEELKARARVLDVSSQGGA